MQNQDSKNIMNNLISHTAFYFDIPSDYIKGRKRNPYRVLAKDVITYIARIRYHITYREISESLGYNSPESSRHSWDRATDMLKKDSIFKKAIWQISQRLDEEEGVLND